MAVDDWFPFADLDSAESPSNRERRLFFGEDPIGKTRYEMNYSLNGRTVHTYCYSRAELLRTASSFFRKKRPNTTDRIISVYKKVPVNEGSPDTGTEVFRMTVEEGTSGCVRIK